MKADTLPPSSAHESALTYERALATLDGDLLLSSIAATLGVELLETEPEQSREIARVGA